MGDPAHRLAELARRSRATRRAHAVARAARRRRRRLAGRRPDLGVAGAAGNGNQRGRLSDHAVRPAGARRTADAVHHRGRRRPGRDRSGARRLRTRAGPARRPAARPDVRDRRISGDRGLVVAVVRATGGGLPGPAHCRGPQPGRDVGHVGGTACAGLSGGYASAGDRLAGPQRPACRDTRAGGRRRRPRGAAGAHGGRDRRRLRHRLRGRPHHPDGQPDRRPAAGPDPAGQRPRTAIRHRQRGPRVHQDRRPGRLRRRGVGDLGSHGLDIEHRRGVAAAAGSERRGGRTPDSQLRNRGHRELQLDVAAVGVSGVPDRHRRRLAVPRRHA